MTAVLIAETDQRSLHILPKVLCDHIPHIAIDLCSSVDELRHKVERMSYDAVAMSSSLVPHYRFLAHNKTHQSLAPLLVTAGQRERSLAHKALEQDAFDLIVKPVVPHEAAQTVRLALWQNRLLKLLASKDRTLSKFREHMETYPQDLKAEAQFAETCEIIDSTLRAIKVSMRLMVSIEEERSFFDMAAAVEEITRKRALSRLITLTKEGANT